MKKHIKNESYGISREPMIVALVAFVIILLGLFILYPLFTILKTSLVSTSGKFTFAAYVRCFQDDRFIKTFGNTIKLGLLTGFFSTVIGFLFAYTISCVKSPFKPFFKTIEVLPLVTPPFVLSFSAIQLLGKRGLITYSLLGLKSWNIYGLKGLVIVQTMSFFPVASMTFEGLFANFDVSMEEAARNMGANRFKVFMTVTIPMMLSGIANVFLIAFIESATDFANPMALGGGFPVLASQIYVQAINNYDWSTGTTYAVILLALTVIVFTVQKMYLDKRSFVTLTGKASREREQISDKGIMYTCNILSVVICLIVLLFYVFMILGGFFKLWGRDYHLVLTHMKAVLGVAGKPIKDTLIASLLVALFCSVLSVLVAFLIVRKKFHGRGFIEFASLFGMAVPGVVFGLGYVLSFNTKPIVLTNTLSILIIVLVMTRLPVGVRSSISSLRQIDPSIEEAAQDVGAGTGKVFTSITIPLIKPAFFSSWVFSFIKSMTAVSAVVFVVSANYNLLTVKVMQYIEKAQYGSACALSTVLIVIVLVVVSIMRFIFSKIGVSSDRNQLI